MLRRMFDGFVISLIIAAVIVGWFAFSVQAAVELGAIDRAFDTWNVKTWTDVTKGW